MFLSSSIGQTLPFLYLFQVYNAKWIYMVPCVRYTLCTMYTAYVFFPFFSCKVGCNGTLGMTCLIDSSVSLSQQSISSSWPRPRSDQLSTKPLQSSLAYRSAELASIPFLQGSASKNPFRKARHQSNCVRLGTKPLLLHSSVKPSLHHLGTKPLSPQLGVGQTS